MNAVATLTHFRDINLQFTPTSFEELSWIYWRKGKLKDKKKNKFEKTPIGKNGLSKEWQKSYQHFTSLSAVLKLSKFKSNIDGVGITLPFTQNNLWLVVIDIDNIDLETAQNRGWIADLNNRFGRCYTEYSLSGRGIHFVCWTTEPLEQKSFTQPNGVIIEIFCKSPKWVAITTDYFFETSAREIIPDCTRELIKLYDEQTELGKAEQKSASVRDLFPTAPYLHTNNTEIREGERNNALTKALGNICNHAESFEEVIEKANNWNQKSCMEPLEDNEVAKTSESIWKAEQTKRVNNSEKLKLTLDLISKQTKTCSLTDEGNCQVLLKHSNGHLKYIAEQNLWMVWNETEEIWEKDALRTKLKEFSRQVTTYRRQEHAKAIAEGVNIQHVKKLGLFADLTEDDRNIKRYFNRATQDAGFAVSLKDIDKDNLKFNVANGILDLEEQKLLKASKKILTLKKSPVSFDESLTSDYKYESDEPDGIPFVNVDEFESRAPRFIQFLKEINAKPSDNKDAYGRIIMKRRKDQEWYLLKVLGSLLSGKVTMQKIFVFMGGGSNGKSVLLELMHHIMGDYALTIPAKVLMCKKVEGENANPFEARLMGIRLAICEELSTRYKVDSALIKKHSGGAKMTARLLHQNPVEFDITHTLVLATNVPPMLDEMDDAIKSRIHIIPFDARWNRPNQAHYDKSIGDADEDLLDKLKSEGSGILSILLDAYHEGQEYGIVPPPSVETNTETYFESQDVFRRWVDETVQSCTHEEGDNRASLFQNFKMFCKNENEFNLSPHVFSKKLHEWGWKPKKIKCVWRYPILVKQDEQAFTHLERKISKF